MSEPPRAPAAPPLDTCGPGCRWLDLASEAEGSVFARWWKKERPLATLVLAHGLKSHSGWFTALAEQLVERGFAVIAVDRRGSGRNRTSTGRDASALWVEDMKRALRLGREDGPVVGVGWCWGARVAIAAATVEQAELYLLAPGLYVRAEIAQRALEDLARPTELLPLPFDDALFSDEPTVVDAIRGDPLGWKSVPRSFQEASIAFGRMQAELLRLELPTFVLLATGDRIVDNAQTKAALQGQRHVELEEMTGGHALVLEDPGGVAERIAARWRRAQSRAVTAGR